MGFSRFYWVAVFTSVLLMACTPQGDVGQLSHQGQPMQVQLGPRPYFLINEMAEGALKSTLESCQNGPFAKSAFSIGHRGAPLQFPEHTRESYMAAARMGAGVLECDVTFTKDKALVCRHSQCDLHTTTNILETALAAKCSQGFTPATEGKPASAQCCTSDITLAEFKTLHGKMDTANPKATNVAEYMNGTASWRTDLYASKGTLVTHAESIALFSALGVQMTPELKAPNVEMPFHGFSQQDYAQKLVDEYKAAGVHYSKVWPQTFDLADINYWLKHEPSFGSQAVYLDDRYAPQLGGLEQQASQLAITEKPAQLVPTMQQLAESGVKVIAPPIWMLVSEQEGKIVPSAYAKAAKNAGLAIIAWSLERSGPLVNGGGWYYQSINPLIQREGDVFTVLDVLAQDIGVLGVFSDWPATTTYYANCMGL